MQGEVFQEQISYITPVLDSSPKLDNQPVPDGPSVNAINHAFYLLEALDYFAKSSGNYGYHTITKQNESGNKLKIRHLEKSSKENLSKGRVAFLFANNLDPNAKNSIKKEQLIASTVVMSDAFRETYVGPGTEDLRNDFRKRLFKTIELLNALE